MWLSENLIENKTLMLYMFLTDKILQIVHVHNKYTSNAARYSACNITYKTRGSKEHVIAHLDQSCF
jgi:hypothetical protein